MGRFRQPSRAMFPLHRFEPDRFEPKAGAFAVSSHAHLLCGARELDSGIGLCAALVQHPLDLLIALPLVALLALLALLELSETQILRRSDGDTLRVSEATSTLRASI